MGTAPVIHVVGTPVDIKTQPGEKQLNIRHLLSMIRYMPFGSMTHTLWHSLKSAPFLWTFFEQKLVQILAKLNE